MGNNKNRVRVALTGAAASASLLATLTSCSPGGVTLGHDWAGSKGFVLVKVSDLTTVAGINPAKASSEPLVVIPSQSDDDSTLAPHLVRTPGGQWLITTPRSGGKSSRLYEIGVKVHDLEGLGQVEGTGVLVPTRSLVGTIIDGTSNSASASDSDLLVYQPGTWKVLRQIQLPHGDPLLAGSASNDTVCTANSNGQVSTVDLASGRTTSTVQLSGASLSAVACPGGKPLLASKSSSQSGKTGKGIPSFTVRRKSGATLLTASYGRVDQLRASATGDEAVVAVGVADTSYLLTVNLASGQVTRHVRLPGIYAASWLDELMSGSRPWVVTDEDKGAVTDPVTGKARSFSLPGQLLSNS